MNEEEYNGPDVWAADYIITMFPELLEHMNIAGVATRIHSDAELSQWLPRHAIRVLHQEFAVDYDHE
jgi:hypothetical protein